jgi:thioredoxin 1
MNKTVKIIIVGVLAVAVFGVIEYKSRSGGCGSCSLVGSGESVASTQPTASTQPAASQPVASLSKLTALTQQALQPVASLPKLLEFGGSKCMTCRRLAPVLAEFQSKHAGRLEVKTFDVFDDPASARARGIRVIPTLIFLDAAGQEVDRKQGFMSVDQLEAAWKAVGVDLNSTKPGGTEG